MLRRRRRRGLSRRFVSTPFTCAPPSLCPLAAGGHQKSLAGRLFASYITTGAPFRASEKGQKQRFGWEMIPIASRAEQESASLRNQGSFVLPCSSLQLRSCSTQRLRHHSEPTIESLKRQGIVPCNGISVREAWNRFGIRRAATETSHDLPTDCISPRSRAGRAYPSVGTGELLNGPFAPWQENGTSLIPTAYFLSRAAASRQTSEDHAWSARPHPQHCKPGWMGQLINAAPTPPQCNNVHDIRRALGAYNLPRKQSTQSKSSYGSALSWVSPVLGHDNILGTPAQPPSLTTGNVPLLAVKGRRRPAIPRWRGTRSSRLEEQQREEKQQLQSHLGRPTCSDDSPYSICNQTKAPKSEPERSPLKAAAINMAIRRRVPANVTSQSRLPRPAPPVLRICNGDEEVQLTTVRKGTAHAVNKISGSTASSSGDEARKLWQNLETTLGVKFGCDSSLCSKRAPERMQASRIPRWQRGSKPGHSTLEKPPPTHALKPSPTPIPATSFKAKERSRLPVRCNRAKQDWQPKVKRSHSVVSQVLQLLRSGSGEDPQSFSGWSSSSTFIGVLPSAERKRREEAIRMQCWGQHSLKTNLQ